VHQGLSRLADQITATANNSATQIVQITGNLEQLAGRVGQSRVDAEDADRALDERITGSEIAFSSKLEAAARDVSLRFEDVNKRFETAEQRLASAEKTGQFNTNALDHALEKIEASANQRATDQVETQRRSAQHEESLNRLEDSIARLEMRLPDAEFERRLDGIERSVGGMADRLESHDPKALFDASMQAMAHRIEALEKDHADLLTELRAKVLRPVEPPAYEAPAYETPRPQAHSYEPPPAPPPVNAFEAPPFAEPPPGLEPPGYPAPPLHDYGAHVPPTPSGFAFDIPPDDTADPFAPPPDFADVFADAPEPENFLSAARRSAREASQKAEGERRGRLSGLRWRKNEAAAETESEERAKSRYLIPALVALVIVLVAAAALFLSQKGKAPEQVATAVTKPAANTGPTYSVPEPPDGDDTQFVVAPQAGNAGGNPDDTRTQRSEPAASDAPPRQAMPLQPREVRNAPVNPVQDGGPRNAAPVGQDRVVAMANQGNPIALTILGLKALDGTPQNLPDAVKFLSQAAEKGQAVAQYRLGTLYERGQGVPADAAKAAHWYEMAANQGNRKAMHNLAVSYAGGASGKKNMAEAARWFAKAAALGLSDSQFNLAVLYERGDGVPQSLLDAYKWYSIAAAAGDSESKARIGVLQSQLGDADKAAANKSAATFHAAPLNRSANVPPEPADLGT
jgi:localization factor PodJL